MLMRQVLKDTMTANPFPFVTSAREWERDAETVGVGGFSGDPGYACRTSFLFCCVLDAPRGFKKSTHTDAPRTRMSS